MLDVPAVPYHKQHHQEEVGCTIKLMPTTAGEYAESMSGVGRMGPPSSAWWLEESLTVEGFECSASQPFLDGVDGVPPPAEGRSSGLGPISILESSASTLEGCYPEDWRMEEDAKWDDPAQSSQHSLHREKKRRHLKWLLRSLRKFFPHNKRDTQRGEEDPDAMNKRAHRTTGARRRKAGDETDDSKDGTTSVASTAATSTCFSDDGISLCSSGCSSHAHNANDNDNPQDQQQQNKANLKYLLQNAESELEATSDHEMAYLLSDDEEVELVLILSQQLEQVWEDPPSTVWPSSWPKHVDDADASMDGDTAEEDAPSLMETRLLQSGLISRDEFSFVTDKVSKEVKGLYLDEPPPENDDGTDLMVTHVKTGVWEVLCHDDGTHRPPFYVVTGVSMDDRVDTKKLRRAVFGGAAASSAASGGGGVNHRRPVLAMAATEIAEELVGFQSGTMAPICHSTNMALYLEESIVTNVSPECRSAHRLNVGSGMVGKCLSIPLDKFLAIAEANPKGVKLTPLVQTKKKNRKPNHTSMSDTLATKQ
jgi:hypothetical protein